MQKTGKQIVRKLEKRLIHLLFFYEPLLLKIRERCFINFGEVNTAMRGMYLT